MEIDMQFYGGVYENGLTLGAVNFAPEGRVHCFGKLAQETTGPPIDGFLEVNSSENLEFQKVHISKSNVHLEEKGRRTSITRSTYCILPAPAKLRALLCSKISFSVICKYTNTETMQRLIIAYSMHDFVCNLLIH